MRQWSVDRDESSTIKYMLLKNNLLKYCLEVKNARFRKKQKPEGLFMVIINRLKNYISLLLHPKMKKDRLLSDPHGKTIIEDISHSITTSERQPYLIAFTGKKGLKRYKINRGRMTLGRSSRADIVLKDNRISGIHCIIEYSRGKIYFEDQGSTNGSYKNGIRIKREVVTTNSNLQIGRTVMKIEYKNESEIEFENELIRKATTDPSTGILNRSYFMTRATEEIALAARTDSPVGLIMLDIDSFKKVNDTYGHQAGDYVINQLSMLINLQRRTEDLFGRYGGEEFVILIRGNFDKETARLFCERIRKSVENYDFNYDGKTISVTVSLGLCLAYGSKIESLDNLIARADEALYKAKKNGRNRVESN
jgi:diguanylate cyclase (GGDEF)-like protein